MLLQTTARLIALSSSPFLQVPEMGTTLRSLNPTSSLSPGDAGWDASNTFTKLD